jgi:ornithine carbamoyltransferase
MTHHFQNLSDLGPGGILSILDLSDQLKKNRGNASNHSSALAGKQVALVFEKSSTRTRLSLEVAVNELGGRPIVLTSNGSQMGRGEPIGDTARVLGRMVHGITLRTSDESRLTTMMKMSGVPVLNALTDQSHPMQILADLQTVRAHFGTLSDLVFCWVGDGNNMAASWIEAAGLLGFTLRLACPKGFAPPEAALTEARSRGATVEVYDTPTEAVVGAHVLSTDVFASMGQEEEAQARLKAFEGFTVDKKLLALADSKAVVLHCLPAHRGEEISDEVLEGPQSLVWDEAEARLHTSKALLLWAFGLHQISGGSL